MQKVIITELESNLSFKAGINNPPEVRQNFSTFYVEEKEVRYPTVAQTNGTILISLENPDVKISNFITKWNSSRRRINLMIETDEHMYLVKGCSIKRFEDIEKPFTVFYNTFKEA